MQMCTLGDMGLISIPRKLQLPIAVVRYPFFLRAGTGHRGEEERKEGCHSVLCVSVTWSEGPLGLFRDFCGAGCVVAQPSAPPFAFLSSPHLFVYWFVCAGPTWA